MRPAQLHAPRCTGFATKRLHQHEPRVHKQSLDWNQHLECKRGSYVIGVSTSTGGELLRRHFNLNCGKGLSRTTHDRWKAQRPGAGAGSIRAIVPDDRLHECRGKWGRHLCSGADRSWKTVQSNICLDKHTCGTTVWALCVFSCWMEPVYLCGESFMPVKWKGALPSCSALWSGCLSSGQVACGSPQ